jgi:hypothetical protein
VLIANVELVILSDKSPWFGVFYDYRDYITMFGGRGQGLFGFSKAMKSGIL